MALENIDPAQVKANSERTILQAGGRICAWLPYLDRTQPRGQDALVGRALVVNAIWDIGFGTPTPIIKNWISANGLTGHLSSYERDLLEKSNAELSEQEVGNLQWSVEALWALMWAGQLAADLPIDHHVPDSMAALCPNVPENEDGAKFSDTMRLRPAEELYAMLDLYYRAHWYTVDGRINGYPTGDISSDIVMERRKALEWLMDDTTDWDNVSLDT